MTEKEVVIDLSKKIKFSDTRYISIGSLLLSTIILILQGFSFGWTWGLLLNFVYAIRGNEKENE